MPKYREIFIKKNARIIVWKISESEDTLVQLIQNKNHLDEVRSRKAESSRKQFLATRIILEHEGLDQELVKDNNGKPRLTSGHISISHDTNYVAVMIAKTPCGIDLQSFSAKVLRVKHKFFDDADLMIEPDELKGLTIAWSIKEALYKINGDPLVYFKEHMRILSKEKQLIHTKILHPEYLKDVTLALRKIDELYLTYTV